MSTLSSLIRWAVKPPRRYCGRTVLDEIRDFERPKEPEIQDRHLDRKQAERLLKKAPPALLPILTVLLNTGARIGELVLRDDNPAGKPLTWDRVDTTTGIVTLHGKRDKIRHVPMNATLRKLFEELPRHISSPYVFHRPDGKPTTYGSIRSLWEVARAAAELPEVKIHDLRHTAASWMVQNGVSLYEVQALLGHTTPITTQRYSHLAPERLRGAVDVLEKDRHNYVTLAKKPKARKKA